VFDPIEMATIVAQGDQATKTAVL